MKSKLSQKIFIINLVVLVIPFITQFLFESKFFEEYYLEMMQKQITEKALKISNEYCKGKSNQGTDNSDKTIKQMLQVTLDKGSTVSVYSDGKEYLAGLSLGGIDSPIQVAGLNGVKYSVQAQYLDQKALDSLSIGDEMVDSGAVIWQDNHFILPISIGRVQKGATLELPGQNNVIALSETQTRPDGSTTSTDGTIQQNEIQESGEEAMTIISGDNENEQEKQGQNTQPISKFATIERLPNKANLLFNEPKSLMGAEIDHFTPLSAGSGTRSSTKVDEMYGDNYVTAIVFNPSSKTIVIGNDSLTSFLEVFDNLNRFLLIACIIVIILLTALSFLYSKRIARPLLEMNSATKIIANQHIGQRLQVRSSDELGQLAESINSMSIQIHDNFRTLEETNEELQRCYNEQIMLKQHERELVASLAHEMKTPLTLIAGHAKGMLRGIYSKEEPKSYEMILRQTDNASKLVYEMLDVSRMESSTFSLHLERIYVYDLCTFVIEEMLSLAEEKSIHIDLLGDTKMTIFADKEWMVRLLENLLGNAIRYTPTGGNIAIRVNANETGGRLEVENEHAPIPESELDNIWLPFYRLRDSNQQHGISTGLGLYIVKEISLQHGFQCCVKNTQNGVCFGLEFNDVSADDAITTI